jgi:hypothetical protein
LCGALSTRGPLQIFRCRNRDLSRDIADSDPATKHEDATYRLDGVPTRYLALSHHIPDLGDIRRLGDEVVAGARREPCRTIYLPRNGPSWSPSSYGAQTHSAIRGGDNQNLRVPSREDLANFLVAPNGDVRSSFPCAKVANGYLATSHDGRNPRPIRGKSHGLSSTTHASQRETLRMRRYIPREHRARCVTARCHTAVL